MLKIVRSISLVRARTGHLDEELFDVLNVLTKFCALLNGSSTVSSKVASLIALYAGVLVGYLQSPAATNAAQ
jgi:hypothetical protein